MGCGSKDKSHLSEQGCPPDALCNADQSGDIIWEKKSGLGKGKSQNRYSHRDITNKSLCSPISAKSWIIPKSIGLFSTEEDDQIEKVGKQS